MIWNLFKAESKSFLGVDIGTSFIKVVELSRWGNRRKLENYGDMQAQFFYNKPFRTFEKSTLSLSSQDITKAILAVMEEAKIKTRQAYFSIPDFSTFFTTFNLPPITREELPQAVKFEARQHIPLPLSEVTLDWQIIEEKKTPQAKTPFKILLVAVPNEIIGQYQEIASEAKLELLALEAEVFGLVRAAKSDQESQPIVLIDIGARSTTISIFEGDFLKVSHSFDTAGNDFTNVVSKALSVDYRQAEELKMKHGLTVGSPAGGVGAREALLPMIDLIVHEVKKIVQNYLSTENKEVQKIILAGGSARLPGLVEYFSQNSGKPVEIINPFANLYCPPILENTLKLMGPSYAIAVGAALRGLK